jgi:hypothetical protein
MTDRVPAPDGRASLQRANDESRERLARLAGTLTPAQLRVDLGEGWTVASALAHMGFWDRWQAERWTEMLSGTWSVSVESVLAAEHHANEALHPYWSGIDAREIPALAVEAAARLDALIASAPDATVQALEGTPVTDLSHRHRHRDQHMDHIERSLAAAGLPVVAPAGGPGDRSFNERNSASRSRLVALAGRVAPADLARPAWPSQERSWTVGQVLGHLAFWDRFLASRWRAALAAGPGNYPGPMPDDLADLLNSSLEPSLAALAGASASGLLEEVVAAAEAVDELIAGLPADAPIARLLAGQPRLLDRSLHRTAHLGTIESALGG